MITEYVIIARDYVKLIIIGTYYVREICHDYADASIKHAWVRIRARDESLVRDAKSARKISQRALWLLVTDVADLPHRMISFLLL